ncbi:hypothetical protein TNCV_3339421 [Trichonephila clavipes]|nr:hypothetical protein TNCV_3339421 [Trichonephila clavipes]
MRILLANSENLFPNQLVTVLNDTNYQSRFRQRANSSQPYHILFRHQKNILPKKRRHIKKDGGEQLVYLLGNEKRTEANSQSITHRSSPTPNRERFKESRTDGRQSCRRLLFEL